MEDRVKLAIARIYSTKANCVKSHNDMDELISYAIHLGRDAVIRSVRAYVEYGDALDRFIVKDRKSVV